MNSYQSFFDSFRVRWFLVYEYKLHAGLLWIPHVDMQWLLIRLGGTSNFHWEDVFNFGDQKLLQQTRPSVHKLVRHSWSVIHTLICCTTIFTGYCCPWALVVWPISLEGLMCTRCTQCTQVLVGLLRRGDRNVNRPIAAPLPKNRLDQQQPNFGEPFQFICEGIVLQALVLLRYPVLPHSQVWYRSSYMCGSSLLVRSSGQTCSYFCCVAASAADTVTWSL